MSPERVLARYLQELVVTAVGLLTPSDHLLGEEILRKWENKYIRFI